MLNFQNQLFQGCENCCFQQRYSTGHLVNQDTQKTNEQLQWIMQDKQKKLFFCYDSKKHIDTYFYTCEKHINNYIETMRPINHFEVLCNGPYKLYFDIDYVQTYVISQPTLQKCLNQQKKYNTWLEENFQKKLQAALPKKYKKIKPIINIFQSQITEKSLESYQVKYSFHVLVDNIYAQEKYQIKIIANEITKHNKDNILSKIDLCPYASSSKQTLRSYGSRKFDLDDEKVILRQGEQKADFKDFENTLVTPFNIPKDIILIKDDVEDLCDVLQNYQSYIKQSKNNEVVNDNYVQQFCATLQKTETYNSDNTQTWIKCAFKTACAMYFCVDNKQRIKLENAFHAYAQKSQKYEYEQNCRLINKMSKITFKYPPSIQIMQQELLNQIKDLNKQLQASFVLEKKQNGFVFNSQYCCDIDTGLPKFQNYQNIQQTYGDIVLQSGKGTGKSLLHSHLIKQLFEMHPDQQKDVLMVSVRKDLSYQYKKELTKQGFCVNHYKHADKWLKEQGEQIEVDEISFDQLHKVYIFQFQSLHKLAKYMQEQLIGREIGLVILDECTELLQNLAQNTCGKMEKQANLYTLFNLCHKTRTVYSDAHIDMDYVQFFWDQCKKPLYFQRDFSVFILNTHKKQHNFILRRNIDDCIDEILEEDCSAFCCTSKKLLCQIQDQINEEDNQCQVFCSQQKGRSSFYQRQKFIDDPEQFIDTYSKYVGYNQTFIAGVNIQKPIKKLFLFLKYNQNHKYQLSQMTDRFRNVEEYHILFYKTKRANFMDRTSKLERIINGIYGFPEALFKYCNNEFFDLFDHGLSRGSIEKYFKKMPTLEYQDIDATKDYLSILELPEDEERDYYQWLQTFGLSPYATQQMQKMDGSLSLNMKINKLLKDNEILKQIMEIGQEDKCGDINENIYDDYDSLIEDFKQAKKSKAKDNKSGDMQMKLFAVRMKGIIDLTRTIYGKQYNETSLFEMVHDKTKDILDLKTPRKLSMFVQEYYPVINKKIRGVKYHYVGIQQQKQ